MSEHSPEVPDRNLALELVRVTEAASLAAARWVGRGDKDGADAAAVDAMRLILQTVPMDGTVIIGEGEKDEAPMLYNGERIGDGSPPHCDIAVDPIEGTSLTADGQPGATSIIAVSERGSMFDPGPVFYMDKLAVGPESAGMVDIDRPVADNLKAVAKAKGEPIRGLTVVVLNRPRHDHVIAEIRAAGARIRLIEHGDAPAAIATAWQESGIDMLIGIGGCAEGVISAAALKCMGGEIQGRLWPRNQKERQTAIDAGYDLEQVLHTNDLVRSDNCFFAATGITDGELLRGVQYDSRGATTQSLVMRSKSGTVRQVNSRHRLDKLRPYSAIEFD